MHSLQHDNGVIDQHADRQRHTSQRHQIQRDAGLVHQSESAENRNRDREADDEGALQVAQEQEQDEDCQKSAHDGRIEHVIDCHLDELGLIEDNLIIDALRHQVRLLQRRKFLLHSRRNRDGIRIRLFVDGELDAFFAVQSRDHFAIFGAAIHVGDVAKQYALAVLITNDDVPNLPRPIGTG